MAGANRQDHPILFKGDIQMSPILEIPLDYLPLRATVKRRNRRTHKWSAIPGYTNIPCRIGKDRGTAGIMRELVSTVRMASIFICRYYKDVSTLTSYTFKVGDHIHIGNEIYEVKVIINAESASHHWELKVENLDTPGMGGTS